MWYLCVLSLQHIWNICCIGNCLSMSNTCCLQDFSLVFQCHSWLTSWIGVVLNHCNCKTNPGTCLKPNSHFNKFVSLPLILLDIVKNVEVVKAVKVRWVIPEAFLEFWGVFPWNLRQFTSIYVAHNFNLRKVTSLLISIYVNLRRSWFQFT